MSQDHEGCQRGHEVLSRRVERERLGRYRREPVGPGKGVGFYMMCNWKTPKGLSSRLADMA